MIDDCSVNHNCSLVYFDIGFQLYFLQKYFKNLIFMQIFSKNPQFKKLPLTIFLFLFFINSASYAQLFQQDFNGGAFTPATINCTSGQVTDGTTYRNATSPSNSQFTYINTSTSGCGTSISVNTTSGKLEVVKTGNNAYLNRSFPFPSNTTSALVRFDFEVLSNGSSNTSAFNFYIGDTMPDGNSSSSYRFHSNFRIGIDASGSLGWRVNSTGAFVTGSQTILLAVNNSGGSLNYLGPDGTCESVGDDKYDLWIGNVRYINEAASSINAGQTLRRFAIVSGSGPTSTSTFDNILIDPIPPTPTVLPESPLTGAGIGFTANWTPVSGVTGYFVDIADDNTFTTNLNTVYVAGASTGSYTFSSLTLGNTYYYRVRAASQYTAGTFQSCNSGTESGFASSALSFSTQPANISQCIGGTIALTVSSTQATTFQWYSNTINSNIGGTLISGATGITYTPPSVVAGTIFYYCVIGNGTVLLPSNVASVRVDPPPTLSGVSQQAAVCGGQNATILLTGLVSGSVNKVYYKVGGVGPLLADSVLETGGGNGSFLFLTTNANNGQLLVIDSIRTSCTTTFSSSVTLSVNTSPDIPTGGVTVTSCTAGNSLTLNVNNPGAGFTTDWYANSTGGSVLTGGLGTNSFVTPTFNNDTTVTYYAQTVSASGTGCSSARVAVVGTVSVPVFTLTNTTLYSPVPLTPFTVNLPYSFATSGLNQYSIAWTSANAITASFPTVTNGTLPASPVVLTLNANAIAGQTYTGRITVRNSTTGCTTASIPFNIVVLNILRGDYGSVASGPWTTLATWRMYRNTTGRFDSVVTVAPNTTTNIWIIDGYTVTANLGGSCKTIHVLNGSLISGTNVSVNQNLSVSGNILEVADGGFIGTTGVDDNADGISFSFNSPNTTTTISGIGGRIAVSRFIIGGINANVVIDHDIMINYHGIANNGYGAALYSNAVGVNVTINPGMTVTMAKWASICNSSAPLTNSGATTLKLNVNGTLDFLPGAPTGHSGPQQTFPSNSGFMCFNTTGTRIDTLNVGTTGLINCSEFYPNGIVASGGTGAGNISLLNMASGGVFNIDSIADFRRSTQVITGAGNFSLRGTGLMRIGSASGITASGATGQIQTNTRNFSTSGRYSYESRSAQVTGDGIPSAIGALIVRDTLTTLTLSKSIRVTDSIRFNQGRLVLGSFDINTPSVRNFRDTNYIVTNGTGSLKIRNVGNTDVIFPVGVGSSAVTPNPFYNPVTLNNIGTPDTFAVRVDSIVPTGVAVSPRLDSAIKRGWTIVEDVQGGSSVTVTPQWLASSQNAQFSNNYCAVIRSNGTIIDAAGSVGPAVGTSPYTKFGSGFTSFLSTNKFGVSTSPKKFRSRDSGPWNEANSWDLYNASGGYSNSEVDFPSTIPYDIIIANTHTINTVSGTSPVVNNLQIDGLLSTLSDDISIHGNWVRSATGEFDDNNKIVKFVGSANAIISANGADEFFPYVTLAKTALANKLTLSDNIKIGKELKITSGTLDLSTKNITLLSDETNTASFASFPASGAAINYSSTGRFVVQRYIHTGSSGTRHTKSWQLLCAPIDPAENITIKQAWMENAGNNQNPNPGFGTQVVGPGGAANGFDQATVSTSLKVFDAANNVWAFVPNTNQNVSNDKGYMLFVRGSRAVTTINGRADSTVLRARGKLLTGSINGPTVPANSFQSVANPYASAIDYTSLASSNLQNYIWVFDPNYGGTTYGLGRFNAIDVTSGNPQLLTPFYSDIVQNTLIQSGQAFLVRSTSSAGSISFNETDKISGSRLVSRANQNNAIITPSIRSTISFLDTDGRYKISDGNLVMFEDAYSDDASDDALKYFNVGDNFSVFRNGNSLAIEKRKPVQLNDTIYYKMLVSKIGNYNLKIDVSNWTNSLTSAILIDKFTNQITPVRLTDSSVYNFDINADAGSKASDRFLLVFDNATLAPLPVSFVGVKAVRKDEKSVLVNWTVSQETNINKYEIERSGNGIDFIKIGSVLALNNASTHSYDFIDEQPNLGVNYYRIRSVEANGTTQLSKTVKVVRANSKQQFTIFPNPVTNNTISVTSNQTNFGKYFYQITDVLGKKIIEGEWLSSQGMTKKINFLKGNASGVYSLKITNELGESFNYTIYKK